MKSKIARLVVFAVLTGNGAASAGTISITADGFAPGTNITNAFKHATVSDYLGGSTYAGESVLCAPTVSDLCSDTLGLVIGQYPQYPYTNLTWNGYWAGRALEKAGYLIPLDELDDWADPAYWATTFRVDFDVPMEHVSVWTYDSEGLHTLLAFDKDGNLIGDVGEETIEWLTCDWQQSANCPEPGQMGYFLLDFTAPPGSSIWTITVTGLDSFGVDHAEATTATLPEPSTLALLGVGLVGLGVRRRRKTI